MPKYVPTSWCQPCNQATQTWQGGRCSRCGREKTLQDQDLGPLFSVPRLEETLRDQGREQATGAAPIAWTVLAEEAVEAVARRQHWLTADDVWEELARSTQLEPGNRGAMAGILSRAAAAKRNPRPLIKATTMSGQSRAKGRHGSRITVWRSLICTAPHPAKPRD